ncbi:DUF2786 domain-containing protein [Phocoenobacter skyensis]|uniref:DUF2786 domain-containing protein n=2 Tax=Phocoenobacter skyensis TaxID=97481 RepID=A0ABT9JPP6_9PAST|nr:DUF2786 domain-containing protein [Pasteurella skyensis]MDP8080213.1 DUF2786 domain-containing protein [Pasteurella skyensis]MDP8086248.1 DUF2786 domain-containing protein [Pasteurella skyensis]
MKQNNEKLLNKIKKLLALSKSSNPYESAKALEMAQKLMAKYQVNQIDIEVSESDSKQKFAQKPAKYINGLACIITKAFGVECYFSNAIKNNDFYGDSKMHAVFFGQEERPMIASYCFDVLFRQLQKARKEFIATQSKRLTRSTLIARADSFCDGWVTGVYQEVNDFALTPKEKSIIEEYQINLRKKMTLKKATTREVGNTREKGYNTSQNIGYQQGRKVKLNHGVNGKETPKLTAN